MLELVYGTDWVANSDYLIEMIADDVRNERGNRLLLVPELISHDTERRLCECAGDTSSRFAEVISFSGLTGMVAEGSDEAVPACMDNGGRIIAMAAAARQLHGSLKAYAAVETKPDFLLTMVDAVDDFKRCCISAQDLQKAAENTQGELAQKLSEIAMLLQAYDAICAQGKRDSSDLLNWVIGELNDTDFAANHVLYVDGFPDLTEQHYLILENFIQNASKVVISLNCDAVESNMLAFEKPGATASRLIKAAKACDVEIKFTQVQPRKDALKPLRDKLFQGELKHYPQLDDVVTLKSTDSVYSECRIAAEDILSEIEKGARYRDFSVVCSDMSAYKPVLSYVLSRMGIPYYLTGTESVLDNSAIATVCAAFDAVIGGMEQRDVLRYLRSALSPVDQDTCDLIENYAFVWKVNGRDWFSTWDKHPDGLGGHWNSAVTQTVQRLEVARAEAMAPLQALYNGLRSAANLAAQVDAVYHFLDQIAFLDRLEQLSAQMDDEGDNRSAQILNQLWNIMIEGLEQLRDVLGQTIWDERSFVKLFNLLMGQYDVGTIPTVLDAVSVGTVSAMRCQRPKHLLVLGCAEGSMPGYSGSTGIFSDRERDEIRKLSVPLSGGAMEGIQAEFAELYGVFCGASKTVSMYYSQKQPSYIFDRVRFLISGNVTDHARIIPSNAYEAAAYLNLSEDLTGAERLGICEQYTDVHNRKVYTLGRVQLDNIHKLYGNTLRVSATQVNQHALCKLGYFLNFGLRVKERKAAQVDPSSFGNFIHYVLEMTVRDVIQMGGFHSVTLDRMQALAEDYANKYAAEQFGQLDSASTQYLMSRNMQEMRMIITDLWEELHDAQYEPVACELKFDENSSMPLIHFGNERLSGVLVGKVDRLDTYRVDDVCYFRIVDYKSSQKELDFCDMYNDIGLQMLLYLFAVEENGESVLGENRIPGGVLYYTASIGFIKLSGANVSELSKREKSRVRNGMILNDDRSIQAMDPKEGHPLLNCSVNKNGDPVGDVVSRAQLKLMKEHVHLALDRMVNDIASGDVDPNPYFRGAKEMACEYCPYLSICHRNETAKIRNYAAIKADRFWDDIESEVNRGGK